jgi:hypothetical protein
MMGLVGLGSTSDYLVHHLHCPVLVIRNIPASGDRILEASSTATEAAATTTAAAATAPTPASISLTTASDETLDETPDPQIQHLSDTPLADWLATTSVVPLDEMIQRLDIISSSSPEGTTPAPDSATPSATREALHQD